MKKENEIPSENIDLRIIKTEGAIKNAFIHLLKRKPYSKITVTDIVSKAMINRNTFYLHYIDKEDLLDSLVADEFKNYDKLVIANIMAYKNKQDNLDQKGLEEFIKEALIEISKNLSFYQILTRDEDMRLYIIKIKDYARNRFSSLITSTDARKQVALDFCFEGCFGVFTHWVETGIDKQNIDNIALSLSKIIITFFMNIL